MNFDLKRQKVKIYRSKGWFTPNRKNIKQYRKLKRYAQKWTSVEPFGHKSRAALRFTENLSIIIILHIQVGAESLICAYVHRRDVSAFGRLRNVGWLNTQCDKLWQAELQTESSKHEKTTFIWICWRRSLDRPWQNSITKWSRCSKNFLWQREVISAFPGRVINYNINIMLCCVIDLMKWIWWLKCIFHVS